MGQQPVADRHAHRGGRAHALRRHPNRRAVPRTQIRCRILGLQSLRAPLAIARLTTTGRGPAHEGSKIAYATPN